MREISPAAGAGPWKPEPERERLLESLESYRRGLTDAPLLRKGSGDLVNLVNLVDLGAAGRANASDPNSGGQPDPQLDRHSDGYSRDAGDEPLMTFVISSEEVDRHGDVISAHGWRLTAYRQNPVFLWAHDYTRPVIGRAVSVWPEADQLLARMQFAPTSFAGEVAALYRSGYQQGVSVGFKPLRYEERRQEQTGAFLGIRFLEQELLEVSAVPVPSNRQALRRAQPPQPEPAFPSPYPYPSEPSPLAQTLAALRAAARW